jgi:hypothetical protein
MFQISSREPLTLAMAKLPVFGAKAADESKTLHESFKSIVMQRLPVYQMLAQKAGFWIEFGDETCWDHNRRTIVLSIKDFLEGDRQLSPSMIDYSILHELGHMKELYDDPEGYRNIIESGKEKYGQAAFTLYNCLMDVYVNSHTAQIAPVYGSSQHACKEAQDVYRDVFFKERNFEKIPQSYQFAYYLLNLGMGTADDISLSPEVRQRIDRGLRDPGGETISYQDFLDTYMRPPVENDPSAAWKANISQRRKVIDKLIRPDFESFLQTDIESGKIKCIPCIRGVGSLLPVDSLEEILKDAERVKVEGKPSQSSREQERQVRQIGKDLKLPVDTVNKFLASYKKMTPTINALAKVWEELKFIGIHRGFNRDGFYSRGYDIGIQKVIQQFPAIQTSPDDARVMYRRVPFDERTPIPRHFNLRLILDTSGSMHFIQQEVRDAAVAFGASLYVKNQESILDGNKISCGMEVHRFSGRSEKLMSHKTDITIRDLMQWYPSITMGGGTADHYALADINHSIGSVEEGQIRSGERVEIVLEITDGDTSNPTQTISELKSLQKKGVLVGAINIAAHGQHQQMRELLHSCGVESDEEDIDDDESEIDSDLFSVDQYRKALLGASRMYGTYTLFEQIWNSGPIKRGIYVPNPESLPAEMSKLIHTFIETSPGISEY